MREVNDVGTSGDKWGQVGKSLSLLHVSFGLED